MDRNTYIHEHHARFGVERRLARTAVKGATGRAVATMERVIRGDEYEVHRAVLSDRSVVYLRIAWPGEPTEKVPHETMAMTRARQAGIPVPEVIQTGVVESVDGLRAMMIVREVPGRQLTAILADLTGQERALAMRQIGQTLKHLHSIAMPGAGLPDSDGQWLDPERKRRRYVANVLSDSQHLLAAGLSEPEIEKIRAIVRNVVGR